MNITTKNGVQSPSQKKSLVSLQKQHFEISDLIEFQRKNFNKKIYTLENLLNQRLLQLEDFNEERDRIAIESRKLKKKQLTLKEELEKLKKKVLLLEIKNLKLQNFQKKIKKLQDKTKKEETKTHGLKKVKSEHNFNGNDFFKSNDKKKQKNSKTQIANTTIGNKVTDKTSQIQINKTDLVKKKKKKKKKNKNPQVERVQGKYGTVSKKGNTQFWFGKKKENLTEVTMQPKEKTVRIGETKKRLRSRSISINPNALNYQKNQVILSRLRSGSVYQKKEINKENDNFSLKSKITSKKAKSQNEKSKTTNKKAKNQKENKNHNKKKQKQKKKQKKKKKKKKKNISLFKSPIWPRMKKSKSFTGKQLK
ncbi:hypothetical protein M0813_03951 [Anaeramoeba flamelloides]|uniref:Uncharacterized protein n=1 Tax=Anaeramoeba flamelloides TaxID=1746091 RepID=A0ABQ8XP81_9EUKA|nr:hypothetical protein M0813_03951 [Anaeramoeba flamelloides]